MRHRPDADIVWQIRITNPRRCGVVKLVWHVHVLRMFTFREQEELMNNTSTYISWWNVVWQLPINIRDGTTGDQFFNKVLTNKLVYVI